MAKKPTAAASPPAEDSIPDGLAVLPSEQAIAEPLKPIKFCGGDQFWQGVPARDLTLEEWLEVPADIRARLVELQLYSIADALPDGG